MAPGRFALRFALLGVAGGILSADLGLLPSAAALIGAGTGACLLGFALRPGSAVGGTLMLAAVLLVAGAVGGWRQHATDPTRPTTLPSVAALADGEEHEIVGTVVDDPRPREDRVQLVLADLVVALHGRTSALGDRLLVWMPRGIDAGTGDRLRVRTEVELAEDFDGFAYREYLGRQGVGGIARPRSTVVVAGASGVGALLSGLRGALLGGLNALVPEPEAALGAGILLGVRASIAPEINEAFATAGLTHVVAISGWNIAIVAALVATLARPLERRPGGRWLSATVAAATVAGYVLLTGASPSVVRAALMAGCMLVARLGGSRAHAASALELAALAMLLVGPPVLWDVGFQLSLLATAGLIWFGAPVERRLAGWPGWIREPVALTLAAQLTTLPVILVNFERLSLVAPIANVLVVPFVPLAMLSGAVAAVTGMLMVAVPAPLIGDALVWFAGGVAWLVLRVIIVLGSMVASVPYAAVHASLPAPIAVAWLPVLGLATWALRSDGEPSHTVPRTAHEGLASIVQRVMRPLPIGAALIVVLAVISFGSRPDGRLHMTVLDIGQGDAILVEAPSGTTMLVDGGPDPELTLRRLGANMPFFARRIDLMVLSHPHQDHIAGLVEALDRFEVGTLVHAGIAFENPAYDRLLADAGAERGLTATLARGGSTLALDPATSVDVLYPTAADASAPLPEGDINNGSVVLVVHHGGFAALLTGDAEAPVEAILVSRGLLPVVDVLKVGHHGSTSSTTPGLLDAVRPTAAIISAGADNEYGHPAPETLAALAAHPETAIFRTDRDGDIEVVTDGRAYRVRTNAGWSDPRPVHAHRPTGSIGPWPSQTEPPRGACSPTPACLMASWSTPRAWLAWQWPPPAWWPRRRFRWTARSSRRLRCSMTSTRSRSGARAASTASSAPGVSRLRGTPSSPCRSPPTRFTRSSTTIAFPSAGRRSSWPWPTGTLLRSS